MTDDIHLRVVFYKTTNQREPVRDWLKSLSQQEKKIIGEDIKTVQFGWPLGMPVVRKLNKDLWEVRSHLPKRIARVIFTIDGETMVLLHGFIKKAQRTPLADLALAGKRLMRLKRKTK